MAEVFVTSDAQADLDAIDSYSQHEFGPAVADRYHAAMLEAFGRIGENPRIAPVFRRRKPLVRSWPCGSHRIYYIVEGQVVWVIRVLHMKVDRDRAMRVAVQKW